MDFLAFTPSNRKLPILNLFPVEAVGQILLEAVCLILRRRLARSEGLFLLLVGTRIGEQILNPTGNVADFLPPLHLKPMQPLHINDFPRL